MKRSTGEDAFEDAFEDANVCEVVLPADVVVARVSTASEPLLRFFRVASTVVVTLHGC